MAAMAMHWRNSADNWGLIARVLHWLIVIAIIAQTVLGKIAEEARISPLKLDLFVWHKSIGVTILLLVALRIAWRLANPPPRALSTARPFEPRLAGFVHTVMYALLIAVPLTGWWVSDTSRVPFRLFWLVPMPDWLPADKAMSHLAAEVHEALTMTLIILVLGHAAAALHHHFIAGDKTLRRMWRWQQDEEKREE